MTTLLSSPTWRIAASVALFVACARCTAIEPSPFSGQDGASSQYDPRLADSVSHFMERCTLASDCGYANLSCECGRCTAVCDVNETVHPLADSVSHFFPAPNYPAFAPQCRTAASLVRAGFCGAAPVPQAMLVVPCANGACADLPTGQAMVCSDTEFCVQPEPSAGDTDAGGPVTDLDAANRDAANRDAADADRDAADADDANADDANADDTDPARDADDRDADSASPEADAPDAPGTDADAEVADADDAGRLVVPCTGGVFDPVIYDDLVARYDGCTDMTGSLYIANGTIPDTAFFASLVTAGSITLHTVTVQSRRVDLPVLTSISRLEFTTDPVHRSPQAGVYLPSLLTADELNVDNLGYHLDAHALTSVGTISIVSMLLADVLDLRSLATADSLTLAGVFQTFDVSSLSSVGDLAITGGRGEAWSFPELREARTFVVSSNDALLRIDAPRAIVLESMTLAALRALADPVGLPTLSPRMQNVVILRCGFEDMRLLAGLRSAEVLRILENRGLATLAAGTAAIESVGKGAPDVAPGVTTITDNPLLPTCEARNLLLRTVADITADEVAAATTGNDDAAVCP